VKEFFDSWFVKAILIIGGLYVAWKYAGVREFYYWMKGEAPYWIDQLGKLW
jgi:hypothetical protein